MTPSEPAPARPEIFLLLDAVGLDHLTFDWAELEAALLQPTHRWRLAAQALGLDVGEHPDLESLRQLAAFPAWVASCLGQHFATGDGPQPGDPRSLAEQMVLGIAKDHARIKAAIERQTATIQEARRLLAPTLTARGLTPNADPSTSRLLVDVITLVNHLATTDAESGRWHLWSDAPRLIELLQPAMPEGYELVAHPAVPESTDPATRALFGWKSQSDSKQGMTASAAVRSAWLRRSEKLSKLVDTLRSHGSGDALEALRKLGFQGEHCTSTSPIDYADRWLAERLKEDEARERLERGRKFADDACHQLREALGLDGAADWARIVYAVQQTATLVRSKSGRDGQPLPEAASALTRRLERAESALRMHGWDATCDPVPWATVSLFSAATKDGLLMELCRLGGDPNPSRALNLMQIEIDALRARAEKAEASLAHYVEYTNGLPLEVAVEERTTSEGLVYLIRSTRTAEELNSILRRGNDSEARVVALLQGWVGFVVDASAGRYTRNDFKSGLVRDLADASAHVLADLKRERSELVGLVDQFNTITVEAAKRLEIRTESLTGPAILRSVLEKPAYSITAQQLLAVADLAALRLVLNAPDGCEGEALLDFAAAAVDSAKREEAAFARGLSAYPTSVINNIYGDGCKVFMPDGAEHEPSRENSQAVEAVRTVEKIAEALGWQGDPDHPLNTMPNLIARVRELAAFAVSVATLQAGLDSPEAAEVAVDVGAVALERIGGRLVNDMRELAVCNSIGVVNGGLADLIRRLVAMCSTFGLNELKAMPLAQLVTVARELKPNEEPESASRVVYSGPDGRTVSVIGADPLDMETITRGAIEAHQMRDLLGADFGGGMSALRSALDGKAESLDVLRFFVVRFGRGIYSMEQVTTMSDHELLNTAKNMRQHLEAELSEQSNEAARVAASRPGGLMAVPDDIEQLRAYARRWEQICALIHLDPDRDPIHTVFEPWKDRREQNALARREAHIATPAEASVGAEDDHPFFGQNDAAAVHEQHRVERVFDERRVRALQFEVLRLRSQVGQGQPETRVTPRRQDVIDVEVMGTVIEASSAPPRPMRRLPEGR